MRLILALTALCLLGACDKHIGQTYVVEDTVCWEKCVLAAAASRHIEWNTAVCAEKLCKGRWE